MTFPYRLRGDQGRRQSAIIDPDLVRFHPFASRSLGLQLTGMAGCPVIATIHGLYDDGMVGWIADVDHVIAVSTGVRGHFASAAPATAEKTLVVANGVDTECFTYRCGQSASDRLSILVAGRFDRDAVALVDAILDTWSRQLSDRC